MYPNNIEQNNAPLDSWRENIAQLQQRIKNLKNELEQQHIYEKQELKKEIIQNALKDLSSASERVNNLNDLKAEEQQNEIDTIEAILRGIELSKNEIASLQQQILDTSIDFKETIVAKLPQSSEKSIEWRMQAVDQISNLPTTWNSFADRAKKQIDKFLA